MLSPVTIEPMRDTEKAFNWIITILESKGIHYKIFGGFAARIYGAKRELADIDIEVDDADIPLILNDVRPYIIFGPDHYRDEEWDLELMTLNYAGQEIDIAGRNGFIFNKSSATWEHWSSGRDTFTLCEICKKTIPVEPKESLIAYKMKIQRDVDIEDAQQLAVTTR